MVITSLIDTVKTLYCLYYICFKRQINTACKEGRGMNAPPHGPCKPCRYSTAFWA